MKTRKKLMVMVAAMAMLGLGFTSAQAADIGDIMKKSKELSAKFKGEIKDMEVVQQVTMTTEQGRMTTDSKMLMKGEKMRMESTNQMPGMGEVKTVVISDGKDTWVISPFQGKKKASGREAQQYQGRKNWWDFMSDGATLKGTEKVNGRNCYVVKLKGGEPGSYDTMWLDEKSLNLIQAESKNPDGQKIRIVSSDFKKVVRGLEFPYKTDVYAGKNLMSSTQIKSLKVNQGIPDSMFDPDKVEAPKMDMQDMMKRMKRPGQ